MNKLIMFAVTCVALTGCSHNTSMLTLGTSARMGIDPQNMSMNASYMDGLSLVDVSRENAEWEIEIDGATGMTYDKTTGTVQGVKKIKRKLGPQISGYLTDLAAKDPESARVYLEAMKYYWQAQANATAEDGNKKETAPAETTAGK